MAFDAGMLACMIAEVRSIALGARIEKVFQPERDEIVLQMRSLEGGKRLLINAGSSNPRFGFTNEQKENPSAPPMLCMLLRKHLQGAKLTELHQEGFERVVTLKFETYRRGRYIEGIQRTCIRSPETGIYMLRCRHPDDGSSVFLRLSY